MQRLPDRFEESVFINCPFDPAYREISQAIVFALQRCGLIPRRADEAANSAKNRFEWILDILGKCKYGVHDVSRVELGAGGFPRFNMPLELGADLGCRKFGRPYQREKWLLILDSDEHRYDHTISDLSGQDIEVHHNNPTMCIRAVRRWLARSPWNILHHPIPGDQWIIDEYADFLTDLPAICADPKLRWNPNDLAFVDLTKVIRDWIELRKEQ